VRPAGPSVLFHRDGADVVEAKQGEVREVVARERLPVEMGVDETKPLEAALAGAELIETGNDDLAVIADDDEVDVALAADQDADLAVGLAGDLAELPGQLEGEDPVGGDLAAVELLDAPELAGLQPGRVAVNLIDFNLLPSRRRRLEGDPNAFRLFEGEVQTFETDDPSRLVLHQDDLFARFFADVLIFGIAEPHGQGIPSPIIENFYLCHNRSPSLMASVG